MGPEKKAEAAVPAEAVGGLPQKDSQGVDVND